MRVSKYNRDIINFEASVARDVLGAIYDAGGKIAAVSDDELINYVSRFKSTEKIKLDISNGYGVAGFMKEAEEGNLSDGVHVILMGDGKADLEIRQVKRAAAIMPDDKIVELINGWLMEYTDPVYEIREALDNAFKEGFVLFVYHNNDLSGIAIIVNLRFNAYLTHYHLAYIATKKTIKGRGIATQLLNKAIDLAEGNISLHVEMDNQRAIKLYKKMGFDSSYLRMIHKSNH